MRRLTSTLLGFVLVAAACSAETAEDTTTTTAAAETTTTTEAVPSGPDPAPLTDPGAPGDVVYFLMIDRFANGDPDNDTGGSESDDPIDHGFLPTDKGFYHGGDLAGLAEQLDYIAGLGATAIWITPPFENRPVQGRGEIGNSSAGYHGYWIVDFERVDPHFGTNDDLRALVDAAHDRGLKVFFDIVANHTADVIAYAEGSYSYRSVKFAPFRDASGVEFDVSEVAGSNDFPALDPEVSFAYTPVFLDPADATAKNPEWLNDPTLYHNRGNSNFTGENIEFGDFFGLDDLFTEHPRVVEGMIDIYRNVITEFDVDGFRVDTAKHVNDEFWFEFLPAIYAHAAELGKDEFFVFGEVAGADPIFNSRYVSTIGFSSVLDFGFSAAVGTFVSGAAGSKVLADLFDDDDWFTTPRSDAGSLVTFVGNHDMGRVGNLIAVRNVTADDEERFRRAAIAFELLFTSRGVPTVYYGDEQGFVGDGGDQDARQNMFPSQVESYNDDDLVGTDATTADDNFDTEHPLYALITELAALRGQHPALESGVQIERYHQVNEGPFVFSRIDPDELVEYVIVTSNSEDDQDVSFEVGTPGATFQAIYPIGVAPFSSGADGSVTVNAPALATTVWRAENPVEVAAPTSVSITRPADGAEVELPRFRIEAETDGGPTTAVSFSISVDGGAPIPLGTDRVAPYRVYWDTTTYAAGSVVELTVSAWGVDGAVTATRTFTLGDRG